MLDCPGILHRIDATCQEGLSGPQRRDTVADTGMTRRQPQRGGAQQPIALQPLILQRRRQQRRESKLATGRLLSETAQRSTR